MFSGYGGIFLKLNNVKSAKNNESKGSMDCSYC